MLALIRGEVVRLTDQGVIVLAGGLGYDIKTTVVIRDQLKPQTAVELVIYEHIREGCHDLYGFLNQSTKDLFELLLTVSGVGPKVALAVLEVGPEAELRAAVTESRADYLAQASGLGRRLADRLIVDLKDKVVSTVEAANLLAQAPEVSDEAVLALVGLGLSLDEARQAMTGVPGDLPTADRVQQALGGLK